MKKFILPLALIAATGCSSYPDYDVKRRAQPLVLENMATAPVAPVQPPKPVPKEAQPRETLKEVPKPAYVAPPAYAATALEVVYQAEDAQTAALLRGYAQLSNKTAFEAALDADKNQDGIASFAEISDLISEYTKEHGEIKLLPVKDGTTLTYSKTVLLPEKRASEMKTEFDNAKTYDKALMLRNWEKTYGSK